MRNKIASSLLLTLLSLCIAGARALFYQPPYFNQPPPQMNMHQLQQQQQQQRINSHTQQQQQQQQQQHLFSMSNICPESFYFYDYEPLLQSYHQSSSASASASSRQQSSQQQPLSSLTPFEFTDFLMTPISFVQSNLTTRPIALINLNPERPRLFNPAASLESKRQAAQPLSPPPQLSSSSLQMRGPLWQILKQTYDTCCPYNKNRMKSVQLRDELALHQHIVNTFNVTQAASAAHSPHPQPQQQGIFGMLEMNSQSYQQFEAGSLSAHTVQLLSSSGKLTNNAFIICYF
jgi:hypothetical protein